MIYNNILERAYTLEFNRDKEVVDIDGISKLPDGVVPAELSEYVKSNYTENFITGWELDDRNQQLTLDNGVELGFSMKGDFLRIDN